MEIVNHKSINAAAKAYFVSYNALYKTLKNLEDELCLTLFKRTLNGITITKDGEKFYEYVIEVLKFKINGLMRTKKSSK